MKKLLKRGNVKNEIECNKNVRSRKRKNVKEKKTVPSTTKFCESKSRKDYMYYAGNMKAFCHAKEPYVIR